MKSGCAGNRKFAMEIELGVSLCASVDGTHEADLRSGHMDAAQIKHRPKTPSQKCGLPQRLLH